MNNDESRNPYQSSLGSQLFQLFIYALSRVLLTEHHLGTGVDATGANLDDGTISIKVTLKKIESVQEENLPKVVRIEWVEDLKDDDAIEPSRSSISDQLFQFFMEAVERVASTLNQESTKVQATSVDLKTGTVSMKVALKQIDAVQEEYLPNVVLIEYVTN